MKKQIRIDIVPILFCLLYCIYIYYFNLYLKSHGLLISIREITTSNIFKKVFADLGLIIFPYCFIFAESKRYLNIKCSFKLGNVRFLIFLACIYILLFFIKDDYSVKGVYIFIFYLIVIAFTEELLIRGYLFTTLNLSLNFWPAAIISGAIWGIMHVPLRAVLHNYMLADWISAILSEISGGALAGAGFAYLLLKGNTIFIPIIFHAILDYSK